MSYRTITRRIFMKTIGAGVLSGSGVRSRIAAQSQASRPNILFIMADDHAVNAISSYGKRLSGVFRTLNIDRIANEGMRLTNCFCTNSICTPSRAVILTGQYSHVNGVYTLREELDRDRQNVAKLLQRAGYQTAVIGKWHLKTEPSGFDYYHVLPGQGLYHNPFLKEKGSWVDGNSGGKQHTGYATDVITDETLSWLERRDKSKPFFLMCHHKAPHGLWEYAERHEDLFAGVEIPGPPTLREDMSHRSAGSRQVGSTMLQLAQRMNEGSRGREHPTGRLDTTAMTDDEKISAAYQKYLKDYLRCVAAVDESVGRLLDYLDETAIADDTVVIYTSDQGMFLGEHSYYDKRLIYEESLRMPFLIRYPKEISAGNVNDDLTLNLDFPSLFLDFAGHKPPSEMQGESFRSNLLGNTPRNWRQSIYYHYWMHESRPAHYGIRTQQFKLIFFYGLDLVGTARSEPTPPGWELYDLKNDPLETRNVYEDPEYAEVAIELKDELLRLKRKYGDTDEKYPELMRIREKYWN